MLETCLGGWHGGPTGRQPRSTDADCAHRIPVVEPSTVVKRPSPIPRRWTRGKQQKNAERCWSGFFATVTISKTYEISPSAKNRPWQLSLISDEVCASAPPLRTCVQHLQHDLLLTRLFEDGTVVDWIPLGVATLSQLGEELIPHTPLTISTRCCLLRY